MALVETLDRNYTSESGVTIRRGIVMSKQYKRVLTIAGSDSGGGAGIQADLKTFSALGCFGMSAITAITAQNTVGVTAIHAVPVAILKEQIKAVIDDIGVDAIKIGMLHSSEVIQTVADTISAYSTGPVVLDPVMVATTGAKLLQDDAIETLKKVLIPIVDVITPNIPEAELLSGLTLERQEDLPSGVRKLCELGCPSVLLKAGHLRESKLVDYYYDQKSDKLVDLPSQRVETPNTHGTGCTLSSAIAANLARGFDMEQAVKNAKNYITGAIEAGKEYQLGKGHGPVHHFFDLWEK